MDKYSTIIRYVITMVIAPFAAKYIQDAAQLQTFQDALYALILSVLTIAPLVYNLLTRPSDDAMKVAVAADQTMKTGTTQAVATSTGTPDIKVVALPEGGKK